MRTRALLLLGAISAISVTANADEPCSREPLKEICLYSSGPFCRDPRFAPPEPQEAYDYVAKNWGSFQDAAKIYGVSREALIGAMIAAYAVNRPNPIEKYILNWLPASMSERSTTSLDPTGVTFSGALEAEAVAAKIEGAAGRRASAAALDKDKVASRLAAGKSSIYYAAALLRQAQDAYRALPNDGTPAGFYRIDDKPEVLATLYLLGGAGDRAHKLADENARDPQHAHPPRMSDFGWYVGCQKGKIRAFLAEQEAKASAQASARADSGKADAGTPAGVTRDDDAGAASAGAGK
jgi:hypothetical protein